MTCVASGELELTLLMPCLDEAETLEVCIGKALSAIARLGLAAEVLVADNGSSDGSTEIARRCGARVVDVEERGYGAALIGGIEAARGRYVIMGDADDSYDWSKIDPLLEGLRQGHDLVMGCRLPWGGGTIVPGAMPWLHRWLGNPVLSFLGRLLFKSPITDFHCGMRGFSRDAMVRLDLQSTGMEFASEMVLAASLARLSISEVPITLHPDGRTRPPHLRTFRDGWRHLRFMLLYSPRWLFLIPGLIILACGVFGMALLLPAPMVIGRVAFDVNTMLVCSLACLVGEQCIIFGVSARILATRRGLLPPDQLLGVIFQRVRLEVGLIIGLILLVLGGTLLLGGVAYWASYDFAELSYPVGLRIVIPAVTLLALGVQTVFAAFFLSMLGLEKKQPTRPAQP